MNHPSSPPTDHVTEFQTERVLTIGGGHFMHDSFSAFLIPLLPIIQERLSTNYVYTGSLVIFTQLPSLLTPFIGYLADRVSLRYFVILAPAVTATLMSSLGFTSSYLALTMLLLAVGVSIAAFHAPAPAMIARVSGERIGTGMSLFMASGELGRTVGPLIAAMGITWWGLEGIWRFALLGWLTSAILYMRLRTIAARPRSAHNRSLLAELPHARQIFGLLTWVMFPRIFMVVALTFYLPLYLDNEKNVGLWLYTAAISVLEGAGVVGALTTGTVSDRWGRRRVLSMLMLLGPILFLLFLFSPTWLAFPLLIALGFTVISPTPVFLAFVQDQFPENRAVANGVFMSLNFLLRAAGIALVGVAADRVGLSTTFLVSALLAVLSIPAALRMPDKLGDGSTA